MPYRFLDEITISDAAFEATGCTLDEMFAAAADACIRVMVEDLASVQSKEKRTIDLEAETVEMLLFAFLQELIYFKDAENLLLRVPDASVRECEPGRVAVTGTGTGEVIDPERHVLGTDVKAVTLHRFDVHRTGKGWTSTVVLDV